MNRFIPPLCLLLALVAIILGFVLLSLPDPEADMELHRVRLQGDEEYRLRLEQDLDRRRWTRRALIGGLFVSGILFFAGAFLTMGAPRKPS